MPFEIRGSKLPTTGPVHENETSTKVNAMKNIPTIPPRSEALSALLIHEAGRVISKAPRKEAAKITKMRKKKMFTPILLAKPLRALAPKTIVMSKVKRS